MQLAIYCLHLPENNSFTVATLVSVLKRIRDSIGYEQNANHGNRNASVFIVAYVVY